MPPKLEGRTKATRASWTPHGEDGLSEAVKGKGEPRAPAGSETTIRIEAGREPGD